ncbi:jg6453 [Pararge aegeria aegeria]|uniref:Jg6453 protein n=1 Tax=Pararge aegeria aegeria TaxID=348720 RepID=A0A8S4RYA9_9NEOP|nr:jg6453 [Pararge aegeria aegeria]
MEMEYSIANIVIRKLSPFQCCNGARRFAVSQSKRQRVAPATRVWRHNPARARQPANNHGSTFKTSNNPTTLYNIAWNYYSRKGSLQRAIRVREDVDIALSRLLNHHRHHNKLNRETSATKHISTGLLWGFPGIKILCRAEDTD